MVETESPRAASRRRLVQDWLDAFAEHCERFGRDDAGDLLAQLERLGAARGVAVPRPGTAAARAVNSIPAADQPRYPGDLEVERRIEAMVRWNALAMVVRANREFPGLGGHISTFASAATLLEHSFLHFFRGHAADGLHDRLFLQGHASPGVYAHAFVDGRLSEAQLDAFRREVSAQGLPSYPHPRSMPGFWEFPSVSMGLAPLMGIYQARFDRYLLRRGLVDRVPRTWIVCGDGEMDEPESFGAVSLAAREELSELVMVVDCNLQRLDGPVRTSGRLVDELERRFEGAGWRVIRLLWGSGWDDLLTRDRDGALVERLATASDADWQRWSVVDGPTFGEEFVGESRGLAGLLDGLSEAGLAALARDRGGHDPRKVHAALAAAVAEESRPTVVLAQTIKGHGLGESGEGRNATHKRKDLDAAALRAFRDRFGVPLSDRDVEAVAYVRPAVDSAEAAYLAARREALDGPTPRRVVPPLAELRVAVPEAPFAAAAEGSGDRSSSTTSELVRLLTDLLDDEDFGERLVPIVPDEARTFGMEPLFRKVGIHAPHEPEQEPVDAGTLTAYRESTDGQLLEEGITEAGAMASTIAAGMAHATCGKAFVPFYFFYSMFGFQRVGDLIWAAGDALARGFLVGATSGRTTLNGEGLQHQDGHSHLLAMAHPGVRSYDIAHGYEQAVVVEDRLRAMLEDGVEELVYLTVSNEDLVHPPLPDGAREGILRGAYRLEGPDDHAPAVRILAAGPLVAAARAARRRLRERHAVEAVVFVVTSWSELYLEALAAERDRRLGIDDRQPWLAALFGGSDAPFVAVSDFVQHLPHLLARWLPGPLHALGTHGFGRSDTREALRRHFEIDRDHIVHACLAALHELGRIDRFAVDAARDELGRVPELPPYPVPRTSTASQQVSS